jgi:SET domain-containing protein
LITMWIDMGTSLQVRRLTARADAQPCYCDEPNCIGYIGGKTQSEAQPKLSHAVKEGTSPPLRLNVDV